MTSSSQVRINILKRDISTSFGFKWTRRKVAYDNNSQYICKQAIIKLSWVHSFRKIFSIGQNLKHVHMTCYFLEFLVFFWLTLVNGYCLEFISHHIKEILYINASSRGNQSWNKNKHFHLFLILILKNPVFLNAKFKFFVNNI